MTSESDQDQATAPRESGEPRESTPERPDWQPLDADGRERPRFLAGFPVDPELDHLVQAFEQGNFARIRSAAPRLAASSTDDRVRAAASELYRRIQPDPVVQVLLVLSLGLLAWIVVWAY